jgi:CheY-like chemotaxis protein
MAKILIIDDEKPVREALEAVAAAAGHVTRSAADGRQGMAEFISFQPDLVITDMLMPEKEGIETIADLRKLRPTLPILAISGGGRVGNLSFLKMAERFGATRTLAKPFSASVLMAVLLELLPTTA